MRCQDVTCRPRAELKLPGHLRVGAGTALLRPQKALSLASPGPAVTGCFRAGYVLGLFPSLSLTLLTMGRLAWLVESLGPSGTFLLDIHNSLRAATWPASLDRPSECTEAFPLGASDGGKAWGSFLSDGAEGSGNVCLRSLNHPYSTSPITDETLLHAFDSLLWSPHPRFWKEPGKLPVAQAEGMVAWKASSLLKDTWLKKPGARIQNAPRATPPRCHHWSSSPGPLAGPCSTRPAEYPVMRAEGPRTPVPTHKNLVLSHPALSPSSACVSDQGLVSDLSGDASRRKPMVISVPLGFGHLWKLRAQKSSLLPPASVPCPPAVAAASSIITPVLFFQTGVWPPGLPPVAVGMCGVGGEGESRGTRDQASLRGPGATQGALSGGRRLTPHSLGSSVKAP